ncbi:MAG TPA: hypothetical protein GX499_07835 [Clostridiales bacterium]|nr:hypothetical protein [Clostridiales bacterium]
MSKNDICFYIKAVLIMVLWIGGIFGSPGAVDLGFIDAGQAVRQIIESLALIVLVACFPVPKRKKLGHIRSAKQHHSRQDYPVGIPAGLSHGKGWWIG